MMFAAAISDNRSEAQIACFFSGRPEGGVVLTLGAERGPPGRR
jgi:hypothetical protein